MSLHCVGRIAFYAAKHITVCNPYVIYHSGVISQHLQRTAWLVGAVIVAVVPVHLPLLQLSASLVLLAAAAAAVAVAMVVWRRGPLPVLLVVPVTLVMVLSVLLGATVRHLFPINECHPPFGIIQRLEVVIVVTVDDVALWHHLQVGSDTVVAGTCVITEVDDTAFVDAFIRQFDPGEAEFVGDVAPYNFHDLAELDKITRESYKSIM